MRNRVKRSKHELRGPRKSLDIGPPNSRGVRSAPFFAQMPNPVTKRAGGRAGGASRGGPRGRSPPGKT
eukprot:12516613-Alexandrium_andersonii.AAC.1